MRYPDWQRRFWSEIDTQGTQSFEWGARDCVLFAATMADAISMDGRYVERAREAFSWRNEREALALTQSGLQSLVESVLGPAIPWVRLSIGDIAIFIDDEGREALGIHDGAGVVAPDAVGLKPIPFRCLKGGWMVT